MLRLIQFCCLPFYSRLYHNCPRQRCLRCCHPANYLFHTCCVSLLLPLAASFICLKQPRIVSVFQQDSKNPVRSPFNWRLNLCYLECFQFSWAICSLVNLQLLVDRSHVLLKCVLWLGSCLSCNMNLKRS